MTSYFAVWSCHSFHSTDEDGDASFITDFAWRLCSSESSFSKSTVCIFFIQSGMFILNKLGGETLSSRCWRFTYTSDEPLVVLGIGIFVRPGSLRRLETRLRYPVMPFFVLFSAEIVATHSCTSDKFSHFASPAKHPHSRAFRWFVPWSSFDFF